MKPQRWEEPGKRKERKQKSEKRKNQQKEVQGRPEGRKVENIAVVKVGLLKCQVRSHLTRWRTKKIAGRSGAKHIFNLKTYKQHQCRSTFGRWDVEKCAHRCGANHISKSNCAKHHSFGPLLRIDMFKKCTPLRPKHISKWKCAKHTIFGWFLRLAILHTKHISM